MRGITPISKKKSIKYTIHKLFLRRLLLIPVMFFSFELSFIRLYVVLCFRHFSINFNWFVLSKLCLTVLVRRMWTVKVVSFTDHCSFSAVLQTKLYYIFECTGRTWCFLKAHQCYPFLSNFCKINIKVLCLQNVGQNIVIMYAID